MFMILLLHSQGLKILVSLVRFRDRAPLFILGFNNLTNIESGPVTPSEYFRISFPNTSKLLSLSISNIVSIFSRSNKFETRGFEATATLHDTSKNNHLAIQQNQKTTSSNVKQPSSAYTLHTLISKRALL